MNKQEKPKKPSSLGVFIRRSIFSYGVTLICLAGTIVLAFFKDTTTAQHAVDGLESLASTVVITYLGVSAIDRSSLLDHVGARLRNGPANLFNGGPVGPRHDEGNPQ